MYAAYIICKSHSNELTVEVLPGRFSSFEEANKIIPLWKSIENIK